MRQDKGRCSVFSFVTLMSVLGFVAESMTEYFFDFAGDNKKYIAAGWGVVLAVSFQVNFFVTVLKVTMPTGFFGVLSWWVGTIVTGLAIGRGSNFIHDLLARVEPVKTE